MSVHDLEARESWGARRTAGRADDVGADFQRSLGAVVRHSQPGRLNWQVNVVVDARVHCNIDLDQDARPAS